MSARGAAVLALCLGCGGPSLPTVAAAEVPRIDLAIPRDCAWSTYETRTERFLACNRRFYTSREGSSLRTAATFALGSLLALGERSMPRALVVGIGSGDEVTRLVELDVEVDLLEDDRELLRVSETVAPVRALTYVDGAPTHPRLRMISADAPPQEGYDLVLHPSAEGHLSMAALFSPTRLAEARGRLADHGILVVPLRVYGATRREIQRALATFLEVVTGEVVVIAPDDRPTILMVMGSSGALVLDPDSLTAIETSAQFRRLLGDAHLGSQAQLLGSLVLSDRSEVTAFIDGAPPYEEDVPITPDHWPVGPPYPGPPADFDAPEWVAWLAAEEAWLRTEEFDTLAYDLSRPSWPHGIACPIAGDACPLAGRPLYRDEVLALARGHLRFGHYEPAGRLLRSLGDGSHVEDTRRALHLLAGELPPLDLFGMMGRAASTPDELALKAAWDAAIAGGLETNGWTGALARFEASWMASVDDRRVEYARTYAAVRGEWTAAILDEARVTLERIGPDWLPGYWALLARVYALLLRPDAAMDAAERAVAEE